MGRVHVHVLGALKVIVPGNEPSSLPRSARRLIAVLAAAGPDGIDRNDVASELWGSPLPDSWMSALRNRVTTARKVLGHEAILNQGGRFRFSDAVSVDSWDLIAHVTERFDVASNELAFLDGEPLIDVEHGSLFATHTSHVADARAALVQEIVGRGRPLPPIALQTLRTYLRSHQQRASITIAAIRAHVVAGEVDQAAVLVENAKTQGPPTAQWTDQLDGLLETTAPRRRSVDRDPYTEERAEIAARAEMFAGAASDGNWSLALEIAMEGLPAATKSNGDPDRLALLEQIPLDKLDANRQFNYCLSMTRHLIYAGCNEGAREWSQKTRSLAESPDQELLGFIMRAIVGDVPDERTPIPLPAAFDAASPGSVSMQSLQVAVMSHLERAPHDDVAPLAHRFRELVEASADPYRRWHLLLFESMTLFVAGEVEAATTAAWKAYKYGQIFGIADTLSALIGQLSNARLVHPGFPGIDDYLSEFPGSSELQFGQALQAVALAKTDRGAAVDAFLRNYDYTSRSFFTFPMVTMLAPYVTNGELRSVLARRLLSRTGTSAIWGTGVVHLGPVDRTLAILTPDKVEREAHLAAAVHVADRQRTPLWQVVTRLDFAHSTGNSELLRQARALATTSALVELVDHYSSPT